MRWQHFAYTFFAAVISMTVVNTTQAQTNQEQSASYIEEIVVTATKRGTSLQDTPISVSVIQMEDIETLAISDILDLQSSVPSLQINQTQFAAQNTFLIRGFGNGANNPGVEPSVAISIDGVSLHIPSLGSFFFISSLIMGVSITPGKISDTLVSNLKNSLDKDSVKPLTACLDAE